MEKAKKPPALQAVRGNEIQQLYICSQLVKQLKELENKGCINANKEIMVIPAITPFSINTSKRFWGVGDIDINRSFRRIRPLPPAPCLRAPVSALNQLCAIKSKIKSSFPSRNPTLLIRSPSVRVSPRWGCLASLLPVPGRLLSVGTAASQKKGGSFLLL